MEPKEQILKAMREAGEPLNAGKVAEITGLDRKIVDKAFDALDRPRMVGIGLQRREQYLLCSRIG